ncbi:MAG: hypothetical protein IKT43_03255, partial [Clostridia bacterium]|nr:hypothetical protein [Clostridia bacterium]
QSLPRRIHRTRRTHPRTDAGSEELKACIFSLKSRNQNPCFCPLHGKQIKEAPLPKKGRFFCAIFIEKFFVFRKNSF